MKAYLFCLVMVGIYKITSPSGKIYVGQSTKIEGRIEKYKKARCKTQRVLYYSLLKYGWDAHVFEVLEECEIHELNDKERHYQDMFDVIGKMGLNCMLTTSSTKSGKASDGTISILTGRKLSDATREKMRNKRLSEETKEKIRQANIGRVFSEETRNKISNSNKGKIRTKEHIEALKLRIISDSELERLKTLNIGRKASEETKAKLSLAKKGKDNISNNCFNAMMERNSKKVIDKTTGIIYNSVTEVAKKFYINRSTLSAQLRGQNNNSSVFEYY